MVNRGELVNVCSMSFGVSFRWSLHESKGQTGHDVQWSPWLFERDSWCFEGAVVLRPLKGQSLPVFGRRTVIMEALR